jgi:hypothetical protein
MFEDEENDILTLSSLVQSNFEMLPTDKDFKLSHE